MITILSAFFLLMIIGIPIGYVMGLTSMASLFTEGGFFLFRELVARFEAGADDFVLVSIPLFILMGELLNRSKMTDRLIDFSKVLVGHISGGLSHVNIVASMFFAGLTGTAMSDTVTLGTILIPSMKKEGYGAGYSAAVTAASSVIGPIIPPSVLMIIYGSMMRASVVALFLAGFIPGILIGALLLIMSMFVSKHRNYPKYERVSLHEIWRIGKSALPVFGVPAIVLGGILGGVTTVSEAAALGALYTLILGVLYRTLRWKDLRGALIATVRMSGVAFLLLCAATTLAYCVTTSGISRQMADMMLSISSNPFVILAMANAVLIIVGMFIDVIPAILLMGPILAPIMADIGVNPLHFALILLVNTSIGNITPPMGMCLMTASRIARVPYERSVKEIVPFLVAELIVLMLITYVPTFILCVPHLLGFGY